MELSRSSKSILPITFLFIISALILMAIPKSWKAATKETTDGNISLSKEWAETITKKQDSHANQELYMLTAARNGYFLCKHCPTGKFFLKAGEVYRYGITGGGKAKRGYSDSWLARSGLNYILLQKGNLAAIKTEETALIGSYALHPENLLRPLTGKPAAKLNWYRLVLPPGNNSLD